MNDFIKSIEVSLTLDFTKNGLADGLNNAIVENMSKLSLYEDQCTVLTQNAKHYIKEDDKWEKDSSKENKECYKESI